MTYGLPLTSFELFARLIQYLYIHRIFEQDAIHLDSEVSIPLFLYSSLGLLVSWSLSVSSLVSPFVGLRELVWWI